MIDQRNINIVITEGLKGATGCEIVKSNLAGNCIPPYPYISFTILNTEAGKGTYSGTGMRYIPLKQTWSFTVQGNDDDATLEAAMAARDWMEEAGRLMLNDQGIVVQEVGPIQNRDTLLSVGYEYRKGFDAKLSLINVAVEQGGEIIEQANIKKE